MPLDIYPRVETEMEVIEFMARHFEKLRCQSDNLDLTEHSAVYLECVKWLEREKSIRAR